MVIFFFLRHPNISSQTGAICLDILGQEWSPALTIRTALLSIQALLSVPEPTDPQDAEVAKQYIDTPEIYKNTARFWTETYARGVDQSESLKKLVDMGFSENDVAQALERNGNDETAALNELLATSSGS